MGERIDNADLGISPAASSLHLATEIPLLNHPPCDPTLRKIPNATDSPHTIRKHDSSPPKTTSLPETPSGGASDGICRGIETSIEFRCILEMRLVLRGNSQYTRSRTGVNRGSPRYEISSSFPRFDRKNEFGLTISRNGKYPRNLGICHQKFLPVQCQTYRSSKRIPAQQDAALSFRIYLKKTF